MNLKNLRGIIHKEIQRGKEKKQKQQGSSELFNKFNIQIYVYKGGGEFHMEINV